MNDFSAELNKAIVECEDYLCKADMKLQQVNRILQKKYPEITAIYCNGDGIIFVAESEQLGTVDPEYYSFAEIVDRFGVR